VTAASTQQARVVAAFNRHGKFTARSSSSPDRKAAVEVEVRHVDTGDLAAIVWKNADGLLWFWIPARPGAGWRSIAGGATLDELVRAVATSVLDEAGVTPLACRADRHMHAAARTERERAWGSPGEYVEGS
jgi:hypothetical protein